MTQQQSQHQQHDPSAEYSAPALEWAALLTLAAEATPARTLAAEGWRSDYFASDGASDAYAQLAAAERGPVLLSLPDGRADLAAVTALDAGDGAALAETRERLGELAQARKLADLQANLVQNLRRMRAAGSADGVGDLLDATRGALDTIAGLGASQREQMTLATLGELAGAYWQTIATRRERVPTGLGALDKALGGGLEPGRLVALLGGPGSGKTALSNQIAEQIASAGRPVVYLSLEETAGVLLAKTISRVGALDYGAVLAGYASLRPQITETLAALRERQSAARLLYVEDAGRISLARLGELARAHFARYDAAHAINGGPGLIVVDYLQKWARAMRASNPSDRRELRDMVSSLTEDLRTLAKELDCTVLALASQNRASGYTIDNVIASGKESGDLEYGCDVLMAIAEMKDVDRVAPLHCKPYGLSIAKNRQGPVGYHSLDWRGDRQHMTVADTQTAAATTSSSRAGRNGGSR